MIYCELTTNLFKNYGVKFTQQYKNDLGIDK